MSYNPARTSSDPSVRRATRRLDPHAGVKHSYIQSGKGIQGMDSSDLRFKEATQRGWRILHYRGNDFEMVYELICARNSTGIIVNKKQDRCIRVLYGVLYLTIGSQITELRENQTYIIQKDVEYIMATSGDTDAEILFCQGAKYEDNVKIIGSETVSNNLPTLTVRTSNPITYDRTPNEKSMQVAERMKQHRINLEKQRKLRNRDSNSPEPIQSRPPLPNQVVIGSNPMPVGAAGYAEE